MSGVGKPGWGGSRAGSGRKAETLSARQVQFMLDKAARRAESEGKDIDDILLDLIYDTSLPKRETMAAIKLWKDNTMVRISEGGDADRELGPSIYLPQMKPDPAKVVPIGVATPPG